MEEFFQTFLLKETAGQIYHQGIKSKETVAEVLLALTKPDEVRALALSNPESFHTINLIPEIAAWWIRTLENLPDVVDQVLAAHLRGSFAISCGFDRPVDNNWTLTE